MEASVVGKYNNDLVVIEKQLLEGIENIDLPFFPFKNEKYHTLNIKCSTTIQLLDAVTPAELLVGAVAKRLDLVVVQNEVAVWSKQVITHQAGVM